MFTRNHIVHASRSALVLSALLVAGCGGNADGPAVDKAPTQVQQACTDLGTRLQSFLQARPDMRGPLDRKSWSTYWDSTQAPLSAVYGAIDLLDAAIANWARANPRSTEAVLARNQSAGMRSALQNGPAFAAKEGPELLSVQSVLLVEVLNRYQALRTTCGSDKDMGQFPNWCISEKPDDPHRGEYYLNTPPEQIGTVCPVTPVTKASTRTGTSSAPVVKTAASYAPAGPAVAGGTGTAAPAELFDDLNVSSQGGSL